MHNESKYFHSGLKEEVNFAESLLLFNLKLCFIFFRPIQEWRHNPEEGNF
jgi:hypothetical protein